MGVFLSFTRQDSDQAELLVSLLEFHGIQVWFSSTSMQAGRFPVAIKQALVSSDALIVLVSKNAISSKWVVSEISTFLDARPGAPILPTVLDKTKPGQILKQLAEYQYFKLNMAGLGKLFATLNVKFLQKSARGNERREKTERRVAERRKASPETRLRKGLWFAYYRAKELDKFEPISPNVYTLLETQEILLPEAKRYTFMEKATKQSVAPEVALQGASERVWHRMKQKPLGAIFVIEAIASEICLAHEITMIDRRQPVDRRHVEVNKAKGAAK